MHKHTAVQLPWKAHATVDKVGSMSVALQKVLEGITDELCGFWRPELWEPALRDAPERRHLKPLVLEELVAAAKTFSKRTAGSLEGFFSPKGVALLPQDGLSAL